MSKQPVGIEGYVPLAQRERALPHVLTQSKHLLRGLVEDFYTAFNAPPEPGTKELSLYEVADNKNTENALMKVFFGGYILDQAMTERQYYEREFSVRDLIISAHKNISRPCNTFTAEYERLDDGDNPYVKMKENIRYDGRLEPSDHADRLLIAARALTGRIYLIDPLFKVFVENRQSHLIIEEFIAVQ